METGRTEQIESYPLERGYEYDRGLPWGVTMITPITMGVIMGVTMGHHQNGRDRTRSRFSSAIFCILATHSGI